MAKLQDVKQLYLDYQKDVYYYLLSLTHNATQAEDLCSETFLKALQNVLRFQGQSSAKTWLFGIARNLWLQSLRYEKDHLSYEDFLQNYLECDLEKTLENHNLAAVIHTLLSTKDEKTKYVVYKRIDGYSYKEIATALAISEGSARVIDFRAKQWLIQELRKEGAI